MGRRFIQPYPFEEAFFLPNARKVRAAVSLPLILLGGITRLDTMEQAMDEGFEFVAMARALLRDPDLPRKLRDGETDKSACVPCNKCVVEMERHGTRCVYVPESEWMTGPSTGARWTCARPASHDGAHCRRHRLGFGHRGRHPIARSSRRAHG